MSSSDVHGQTEPPYATRGSVVDGKYRVEETLGRGGMGLVVRATHLQLRESVALKFLHVELARNPTHVQRFLREARAAVRIKSEHIASVVDAGVLPTGEPFMVMDLLVGQDLSRVIRQRGQLPVAEAVDYVIQACRAIAEAHRHGIIHRDLKPANLFLTRRSDGSALVKVLDFGISKLLGGSDETLTATSDVLGSPVYMSPEQIRDVRSVDGRSDIWALGSILYKLLAGVAPFAADTSAGTLARIIADPVPPLRATRPDVPLDLEAVILRCLEKSPARRFARVEDLSTALEATRSTAPTPPAGVLADPRASWTPPETSATATGAIDGTTALALGSTGPGASQPSGATSTGSATFSSAPTSVALPSALPSLTPAPLVSAPDASPAPASRRAIGVAVALALSGIVGVVLWQRSSTKTSTASGVAGADGHPASSAAMSATPSASASVDARAAPPIDPARVVTAPPETADPSGRATAAPVVAAPASRRRDRGEPSARRAQPPASTAQATPASTPKVVPLPTYGQD